MNTEQAQPFHIPVLLESSIASLAVQPGDIVIDGTFGGGGHSKTLLDQYGAVSGNAIELVSVDLDEQAEVRFEALLESNPSYKECATFVHSNFKDAAFILETAGKKTVNKVLLDLGTSTFQLLQDTRGFSFNSETPLHMTFSVAGSHTGFTAYDIVNTWSESSIADIVYGYGEDPKARIVARAIVVARKIAPIQTAKQLADIIEAEIPRRNQAFGRGKRIHPATKAFQALRIAVNDELAVISEALNAWWALLAPEGRIAVITFHSLEDRIVKQWMKQQSHARVITKKPIIPNDQELQANPRSRSAKLRIIEKNI